MAEGADGRRVTIVLPCLNESTGVQHVADALVLAVSGSPDLRVTAMFVDDGSTDDTWEVIQYLTKVESGIQVRGLRLRGHQGKGAAQAAGIRAAVESSDFIVVMDSDGQHDPSAIPQMIARSITSQKAVIATRTGYRRGAVSRLGTVGLNLVTRLLGVAFDPMLTEFMVLPTNVARALVAGSRLGYLPLVPLVQATGVDHATYAVRVLPRNADVPGSRWGLGDLWHKAIMHLLVDPWSLLPRVTLLIAAAVAVLGSYGLVVGIVSVLQGTFLGIGSVLITLVAVFGVLATLMCATLGVAVVAYQSSAGLAGQPGVQEEVG